MIFRTINSSGDWSFGRGVSGYASDEKAIELNIQTRLKSWKGNCFFDLDAGIDWSARLDKNQMAALVNELRAYIVQSYGVVAVNSVTVNHDTKTRAAVIQYNVDTIYSPSFTGAVRIASGSVGE